MSTTNEMGIRPLRDVIVDEIRAAIEKTGSAYEAAKLLGVAKVTIHCRLRAGYSDGNKPHIVYGVDQKSRAICTYDWKQCDRARRTKPQNKKIERNECSQ